MDTAISMSEYQAVYSFEDLISKTFHGKSNATYWNRELKGDFKEIAEKLKPVKNIRTIEKEELLNLDLGKEATLARDFILRDLELLEANDASPVLNLINCYDRDDSFAFFPTDVYSFHVDRSPIPVDTILCTYFGETSEILANSQAKRKVLIPEIRQKLKEIHTGNESDFEEFLCENFFDLHYQADAEANIIKMGVGQMWKLAVDHPKSQVLPCIHRAPKEKEGEPRLMLIC